MYGYGSKSDEIFMCFVYSRMDVNVENELEGRVGEYTVEFELKRGKRNLKLKSERGM